MGTNKDSHRPGESVGSREGTGAKCVYNGPSSHGRTNRTSGSEIAQSSGAARREQVVHTDSLTMVLCGHWGWLLADNELIHLQSGIEVSSYSLVVNVKPDNGFKKAAVW